METIVRVHDFGEDLSRDLWRNGQGELPLEEADRAVDQMMVKTVPRFAGQVTLLIKKLLKKHRLQEITQVVRE
jgi:hypothetical protein